MSLSLAMQCIVVTLLAVTACAPRTRPLSTLPGAQASATGFIPTSDGLRLFYRIDGNGRESVLALHGGPGASMAYLQPDLVSLAGRRAVIWYDQRGAGHSSVTAEPTLVNVDKHVDDLETVRQFFGLDQLTLVGHSWGAGLAALYAGRHPNRVRRLLLVDPMPPRRAPYVEEFSRNLRAWMDEGTRRRVDELAAARRDAVDPVGACRAFWAIFIRGYVADPMRMPSARGDVCDGPVEGVDNQGLAQSLTIQSLGDWDWRAALRDIHVPTLVVHGERDPIPLTAAREWVKFLPNARLFVVINSGHLPYIEQPETFFNVAEQFLAGRWPRGSVVISSEISRSGVP